VEIFWQTLNMRASEIVALVPAPGTELTPVPMLLSGRSNELKLRRHP